MEYLLAAASLVLGAGFVVGAELAARWAAPDYLEGVRAANAEPLHRYSETYGWDLRPKARRLERGLPTTINAKGYRGREVGPKAPGRVRVLLLGDSITFGTYVADTQTFAHLLDARDNGLEVVNLAVTGYGPGQSLLKLEHEGLACAPDVVVFNLCLANDFADAMLPVSLYDGRHPKPYHRIERGELVLHDEHLKLSPMGRLGMNLREHSHLYNRLFAMEPAVRAAGGEPSHWVARRNAALREPSVAIELTVRLVARMRDLATAAGAAFVLALHPDKPAFAGGSEWADALRAAPELQGVRIVDLREEYRRRDLRFRNLVLDSLGHLSARGHRVAARILEPALLHERPPFRAASSATAGPAGRATAIARLD